MQICSLNDKVEKDWLGLSHFFGFQSFKLGFRVKLKMFLIIFYEVNTLKSENKKPWIKLFLSKLIVFNEYNLLVL